MVNVLCERSLCKFCRNNAVLGTRCEYHQEGRLRWYPPALMPGQEDGAYLASRDINCGSEDAHTG